MTVIAAVDKDDHATDVIQEAAKHADAFDQELHVIHVLSQSEFVSLERTSVEDTGEAIPPEKVRDVAKRTATDLVDAANIDTEYTTVGVVGEAGEEILRYAREHDADYIVVGGRRRSALGKVLFGSVTQSVLLSAPCPVVSAITAANDE